MATPFLSELKLVSFGFAPKGWSQCNGQLLPINQNQALFSLLGTTYGGDGRVNFGLPNLQGRIPIHMGGGHTLGERGGEEFHTLTIPELPQHQHLISAATGAQDATKPAGNFLTTTAGNLTIYTTKHATPVALDPAVVPSLGGSQPHENRQPFLTLNWVIALQGIFPSQT
jgi:microcystin-dependent protein